ncbi:hypothetical protein LWM68_46760 [Niabella sp. W65]|nr:hypothetical protein [Niabella sp. W65]MCH7369573.1 hypothetical protein [Niabella sp. W65]
MSYRSVYKTLDDLNQDEMRLAGLRINPVTNISSTVTYSNNLKIRKIKDVKAEPTQVSGLPAQPRITYISWSPDDSKIAFTNTTATGVELWVIDVATAAATRLTDANLNANMGMPYSWYKDNKTLLVRMIPVSRPALIDSKKDLPKGPIVSVAEGKVSQNRTYQDLLKNKTDEQNFETLVSAELYNVSITGDKKLYKGADIYDSQSISPDGNYIMLTTIKKPFSYIVPLSRFPQASVVYDLQGREVKTVNEKPLVEIMPKGFGAVVTGKRSMAWRADQPASLYYVEALDKGDPANKVEYRDELFTWEAPLLRPPYLLLKQSSVMEVWFGVMLQLRY